ncbi:MAG: Thrombospondin type 3 repeat protein [Deltaproteobacteria bacterium]|nr:Thrombospondin type 3 repeat protein [Deltaproteobacteria bacterium]
MRAAIVGCLLGAMLPACDVVLGLEISERDRDRDGVDIELDNCPEIANVDQLDGDLDLVGDACDLCPGVSDDQHDEDGDGIGDRCDSCPYLADEGGPGLNTDGDDLGDPCDDGPEIDCIAMFDGFGVESADWDRAASTGTWSIDGDAMVQQATVGEANLVTVGDFTKPAIELHAIATAFGGLPRSVGVWGRTAAANATVMVETIVRTTDPMGLALISTGFTPDSNIFGAASLVPKLTLAAGASISLRFDLRDQANVLARGDVGRSTSTLQFDFDSPPGHVALRTNNTAARFDYLLIVTRSASSICPPR